MDISQQALLLLSHPGTKGQRPGIGPREFHLFLDLTKARGWVKKAKPKVAAAEIIGQEHCGTAALRHYTE